MGLIGSLEMMYIIFSCVCLFFLADEASLPVFVCHRSVATLTIHLSIVFSN